MNTTDAVTIRRATETDVAAVRELFIGAYGNNYPFEEFLDVCWLKKAMFDDDTLFLVAVENGKVIGTISAMLAAGGLSDLIGEIGRLVVSPEAGGKKIGTRLMQATLDHITSIIQFGFAEGRTAHQGSQKILEHLGFTAIGFEPLKYILDQRESMVLYGRLFDQAVELRRNCPRLIPEIAPLAMHVLDR
ncbi:MAG: GNAT family N-acetyltransferase, partial [Sedimentisphaerales bacterium]|nr:GNAT family N-acetyltransferase [Sedimentisphaerales bacterium]